MLLLVLVAFAYRGLLDYDPDAELRITQGAEGFVFEPAGGSPALLFAVSAWMLWRRRRRLAACLGAPPWPPSGFLLPLGVLLAYWAYHVTALDLLIPSLTLVLLGAGGLLGGSQAVRHLLLPALFLLFAIPIPSVLVNQIVLPLQLATASATHDLLRLVGVASSLQGDLLFTMERTFQVIETCSGLRLMHTLTFSAVVYAELLERSRLQMLLLVLLAPLVGALVNVGRVISIVLNPYSDFSAVHSAQGIVMLVVGVLLLAGLDSELHRLLQQPVPGPSARPEATGLQRGRILAVSLLLLAVGIVPIALPAWEAPPKSERSLYYFPLELEGWRSRPLRIDSAFLGSVGFSERIFRQYQRGDESVAVFVGADTRLVRQRSLLSPKTALPGTGWVVEERDVPLGLPDHLSAEGLAARGLRERRLVAHWRLGFGSLAEETLRQVLALDRGPFRRPGRALVVRLETRSDGTPEGVASARARLRELAPLVEQAVQDLGSHSST